MDTWSFIEVEFVKNLVSADGVKWEYPTLSPMRDRAISEYGESELAGTVGIRRSLINT